MEAAEAAAGPRATQWGAVDAAEAAAHGGAVKAAEAADMNAAKGARGGGRSRRHRQGREPGDDRPGNRATHDPPPIAGAARVGIAPCGTGVGSGSYRHFFACRLIYDKNDASEADTLERALIVHRVLVRLQGDFARDGHADPRHQAILVLSYARHRRGRRGQGKNWRGTSRRPLVRVYC